MRRSSKNSPRKLSGDSQKLANLVQGFMQSSSRLEVRTWERHIDTLLHKLLKTGHQETIDTALDYFFKADLEAYETLMEAAEANSETYTIEQDGIQYEALLIAAPILAWTRFSIASGPIATDIKDTLATHLKEHILASDTRLVLAPTLFAIDQLPRTHAEAFSLTQKMTQAALKDTAPRPAINAPETAPYLADTRYLLAVVVARAGEPLFRWQATMEPLGRTEALTQWQAQATPILLQLLPGCSIDLLIPEAYYIACREADKRIRPASIRAAIHFLTNTLGIESQELRVIIGDFSENAADGPIDEYRVGFALRHSPEIIYGIVWPLLGQEDENIPESINLSDTLANPAKLEKEIIRAPLEEILELLREGGIVHIKHHTERFPMEFCDDCGTPLYPDPDAELVHPEMPEDAPSGTEHFH